MDNETLKAYIRKYVAISKSEKERYFSHFNALKTIIIAELRAENIALDRLIVGHSLEGSTGDNLKVARPDEFDLVFNLGIPFYETIVVTPDPQMPGNVRLDLTRVLDLLKDDPRKDRRAILKLLKSWVDENRFLVVNKLCSFMQGSFTRALNRIAYSIKVDGQVSVLTHKMCGPAQTIFVKGNMKYSVDFVPAIRLGAQQNVLPADRLRYYSPAMLPYWEAIAKPLKTPSFRSANREHPEPQTSFRSSFYKAEQALLRRKHPNCRDAIKIMKKLRDTKTNLTNLKSYYIKTLFLWKISDSPDSYWQEHSLTVILTNMFAELTECLRQHRLPFFWDAELNMLDVLTANQVTEMYRCVQGMSKQLNLATVHRSRASPLLCVGVGRKDSFGCKKPQRAHPVFKKKISLGARIYR